EVVGVVDHAHLVRFGVANPHFRTGRPRWRRGLGHPPGPAGGVRRLRHQARCPMGARAASRSARVAASGLPAPNTETPATRIVAPAATSRAALDVSTPPSTSIAAGLPAAA